MVLIQTVIAIKKIMVYSGDLSYSSSSTSSSSSGGASWSVDQPNSRWSVADHALQAGGARRLAEIAVAHPGHPDHGQTVAGTLLAGSAPSGPPRGSDDITLWGDPFEWIVFWIAFIVLMTFDFSFLVHMLQQSETLSMEGVP